MPAAFPNQVFLCAVRGREEKEKNRMDMTLQAVLMDERRYGYEEGYEEGRKEGYEEGLAEGRKKIVRKVVVRRYRRGISPENIALDVDESLNTVTAILKEAGCIS